MWYEKLMLVRDVGKLENFSLVFASSCQGSVCRADMARLLSNQ